MLRDDVLTPPKALLAQTASFIVLSGLPALATSVSHMLTAAGFHREVAPSIVVLLDTPHGFALEHLQHLTQPHARTIVMTSNMCPEYWEDLWDCQIEGLLVGLERDLTPALLQVAAGQRYRNTPPYQSSLTVAERRLLHLLGHGQSNQQIADHLCVQCQTVRNMLATIYQKLCVKNRGEALLYYWGILHTRICHHL